MKFGGSSLAGRERVEAVAGLVAQHQGPVMVVVSAMGKTTDQLLAAAHQAERGRWQASEQRVAQIVASQLAATDDPVARDALQGLFEQLRSVLKGVSLLRECTPRSRALIVSFGERMSVEVVAASLRHVGRPAVAVDARDFVRTSADYDEARVEMEPTYQAAVALLQPLLERDQVPVITGFIGATEAGVTTTLGRGGSDYSAALLGSLMEAREIWIWTDVDGILTADPRLVSEARSLAQVSYREAAEMSYFGARVLHPKTMLPAMAQGIPIRIRSTFNPSAPGTLVAESAPSLPQGVKTVTSIREQALVTVDGRGLAGVVGVASRIFAAAEQGGVNIVMISQASSEQTVSLVVAADASERLLAALREAFRLELAAGLVEQIEARPGVALVSIIGQGMAGRPGVAGSLFGALGQVGVNVLAIAQGASELSISVAIDDSRAARAVRAVHTAFGLTRVVHVVLLGHGRVGKQLCAMLHQTRERLASSLDLELRLVGVATGSFWLHQPDGLDPRRVDPSSGVARPDDAALVEALVQARYTDVVLVDVSAAPCAALHTRALEVGFHVVTANKLPLSGPLSEYRALQRAHAAGGGSYGYETTFGAGLPVLHTLKELLHTGDQLVSVSGCFSGTLGYLCTCLQDGQPLSQAVAQAEALGFTEPDPREDLSGRDVARKALIIARAMGRALEPEQVICAPLVPGLEAGLEPALQAYEPELAARVQAAAAQGEVLRYVAAIDDQGVRVGLEQLPATSPIGSLRGPDNILVFRTRRYFEHPLVIRGPGAGAEVTAAGVLGDLLRRVGA